MARRWTWLMPLVIAIGSLMISAYVAYANNDKETASRISVIEARQTGSVDDLRRINDKLDWMMEHWYDRPR